MKRTYIPFLLCSLVVFTVPAAAENPGRQFVAAHSDFFRLFLPDKSELKFGYLHEPSHEAKDGPGEFDLHDFYADLDLPLPLSPDSFLTLGMGYEARKYDFSGVRIDGSSISSETLYKIVAHMGAGHFVSEDLMFVGSTDVGLFSNLDDGIKEDDWQVLGSGMAVYRLNPGAQIVLGAGITEDFDEYAVIPLVGVRLLSGDGRLHIDVTLPIELKLTYQIDPNLEVYGGGWISGDEFRVRDLGSQDFDVQVQDRRVGVGLVWWLGNHLSVGIEGGVSVGSELEFKFEDVGEFDGELETGPYVTAGIGVAL